MNNGTSYRMIMIIILSAKQTLLRLWEDGGNDTVTG